MKTTQELIDLIKQSIARLSMGEEPSALYQPMQYIMNLGGKRVRPLLCLLAYQLYRDDVEAALEPALGLEMFHNFTLLHDDVMDRSFVRRGKPCVHVKWDENTAILSGDGLQVVAYQYIQKAGSHHLDEALSLFSRTALEVCEGQAMDMMFETRESVAIDEYLEMIRLKTAVLLACSLKMGGLLADAPAADLENLYTFGLHTGIAFQIRDDLLDVWGDPAVFGKAIGGDIMFNKKTFPLIHTMDRADEATRAFLLSYMKQDDVERGEKIRTVTDIYNRLGIREVCEQQMQVHQDKAMNALSALSVPAEKLAALRSLAEEMMQRQY